MLLELLDNNSLLFFSQFQMWKVAVLSIILLIIVQVYSQTCGLNTCNGNGECLNLNGGGTRCICDSGFTSDDCSQGK